MKNVLLLVHDDAGQESRLQVALDLTRALEGHLTCLDVTYVPPMLGNGFYEDAYVMADLMTEETTREANNKQALVERLSHEDVSWSWIDKTGEPATLLRRGADDADVIVLNRKLDHASVIDMRRAAAELIVRSGKPVMVVPEACARLRLDSVLVAWDGSPRAAAALHAAVPILRRSSEVTILEIDDGSISAPAEDAARYLSRYDVHAEIRRVPAGLRPAEDILLAQARSGIFGFVVMGGFGHSRLVEALIGGTSRRMLSESPVPVLFAH